MTVPKLSTKWYKAAELGNAEQKDKDEFAKTVYAAKHILDLLYDILEEDLQNLHKTRESDYDKGNWAYYQADQNGQIRQLNSILNLIDLEGIHNDPT